MNASDDRLVAIIDLTSTGRSGPEGRSQLLMCDSGGHKPSIKKIKGKVPRNVHGDNTFIVKVQVPLNIQANNQAVLFNNNQAIWMWLWIGSGFVAVQNCSGGFVLVV